MTTTVEYMTTEEIADKFRTTQETVRSWRRNGKGPRSIKIGRRVLYAVDDVERFIAELHRGGQAS